MVSHMFKTVFAVRLIHSIQIMGVAVKLELMREIRRVRKRRELRVLREFIKLNVFCVMIT